MRIDTNWLISLVNEQNQGKSESWLEMTRNWSAAGNGGGVAIRVVSRAWNEKVVNKTFFEK